jgi:hypothetical protein
LAGAPHPGPQTWGNPVDPSNIFPAKPSVHDIYNRALTRVQSHLKSRLDELLPVAWKRLRAVDTSELAPR